MSFATCRCSFVLSRAREIAMDSLPRPPHSLIRPGGVACAQNSALPHTNNTHRESGNECAHTLRCDSRRKREREFNSPRQFLIRAHLPRLRLPAPIIPFGLMRHFFLRTAVQIQIAANGIAIVSEISLWLTSGSQNFSGPSQKPHVNEKISWWVT